MKRLAAALLMLCSSAFAQGPGGGDLRAPPPEPPVRERSLPGEAIGAKAGTVPDSAAPVDNRSRRAAEQCRELSAALRGRCLAERPVGASAGAGVLPQPRAAPPPQNPR